MSVSPSSLILSTIATFSSPPADASACIASASTSQPSSPVKNSETKRSTRVSGSSPSSTTTSDTSISSSVPCNPSTSLSAQGCHPCLRYALLPMSPGWTQPECLVQSLQVICLVAEAWYCHRAHQAWPSPAERPP